MPVDEEILLLRTGVGNHRVRRLVSEELENALRVRVQRLHRAQQRRLFVERLAGPRYEGGRNTERRPVRVLQDIGRARHVPHGVAARLERVADAPAREARRVRFTLGQRLAGELGERPAVAVGRQEAVVLLGREPGQRVENVRVVGGAFFDRPVLHRCRDGVRDRRIQGRSRFDGFQHRLVYGFRQPRLHHRFVEDVRAEELGCRELREREGFRNRTIGGDGLDGLKTTRTSAQKNILLSIACTHADHRAAGPCIRVNDVRGARCKGCAPPTSSVVSVP